MKKFGIRASGRSLFLCLVAFAFLAIGAGEARADPVTFSTLACFGANCVTGDSPAVAFGTTSVVFTSVGPVNVNTPVVSDLGQFTVFASPTPSTIAAIPFKLVVTQTVPGPIATGTYTASLSGTVTSNSGFIVVTFDSPTLFVINGVTYTLVNIDSQNRLFLDPNASGGITRVSARIEGGAVPEPLTVILFGTGLAGVAAKVRRRKAVGR